MGEFTAIPSAASPVNRLLARFDRGQIEGFIAVAIDLLDTLDVPGDPEVPDFRTRADGLPGEPGDAEPAGDDMGDVSWPEWQTRGRHKLVDGGIFAHEPVMRADAGGFALEDDEEDDAAEANGDEEDTGDAEDEGLTESAHRSESYFRPGPGYSVADCGERDLGAPEAASGRWGSHLVVGDDTDDEPWVVPATLNPPGAENDR